MGYTFCEVDGMIARKQYLNRLIALRDTKVIKVVTGVRRSGKSTLLELYREYLLSQGVPEKNIISVSFELLENQPLLDYHKLHQYILDRLVPDAMNYVFLDEIQEVPDFQKAVDSLFVRKNVDLYITGSNARMLSGELSTLLSGRYIEIQVLPFSFAEYYSLIGGDRRTTFAAYLQNGGLPYAAQLQDSVVRREYLEGIFNTVLLKDVVQRKDISDVTLLRSVIRFLFDNVGNIVSVKKIADSLTSYGRSSTAVTVGGYVEALMEAFILYKAERYDVRGKQLLKSLEKYYLVDLGFRQVLFGENRSNIGFALENVVYLELLRRGYHVMIGKVSETEVDFIAERGEERIYYQVAASVLDPATFAREIAPLKKIKDNYPKYILTLDDFPMQEHGIPTVNVIDFLLKD